MIIAKNQHQLNREFETLLYFTAQYLLSCKPEDLIHRGGREFEDLVFQAMVERSISTPFEGQIEIIGGQAFPDIIANKYYGVEVKTSQKADWKTTGNSVLETTRIDKINKIYLFFTQLLNPINIKYALYQDCLSAIVVTHYPRYKVDMMTPKGQTIFDKMGVDYVKFRQNPIPQIRKYYKEQLKPGDSLWWLDAEENIKDLDIIIKTWDHLTVDIKNKIRARAFSYFPEIYSSSNAKFKKIPAWLVQQFSVVTSSLRDLFSAGGRKKIQYSDGCFIVPKIIWWTSSLADEIYKEIKEANYEELIEYWGSPKIEDRFETWINLVHSNFREEIKGFNFKKFLIEKLDSSF